MNLKWFKGFHGDYEVVDHNYQESSIVCGDHTIATLSISEDEEDLELAGDRMDSNARLLAESYNMLKVIERVIIDPNLGGVLQDTCLEIRQRIKDGNI